MKKQIIIIGIIILLITIELSGCNDIGLTNIGDLQANPENYLGKEVKVKGIITSIGGIISDEQGHNFRIKTDTVLTGDYYITGIVENDILGYYIRVTKVDAV